MGEIISRVRPPKLDHFEITPKQATELAQKLHNENDENGNISEGKIIDYLMDHYSDELWQWLEQHVDFDKIRDDDEEMADFIAEKEDASKGEY